MGGGRLRHRQSAAHPGPALERLVLVPGRQPNPGGPRNAAGLIGVAAISASSAWAVGSYSNGKARQTLILRGNTTFRAQVHSPSPGGLTHDSRLTSVAVVSARDAWAVGYYQTAQAFRRTLILHWNGKSWSQMPSPDPGGSSHGNLLFGVSATSARDAWAVGYDTTKSGADDARAALERPGLDQGAEPESGQLAPACASTTSRAWPPRRLTTRGRWVTTSTPGSGSSR